MSAKCEMLEIETKSVGRQSASTAGPTVPLTVAQRVHDRSVLVEDRRIVAQAGWLKVARVFDEPWLDLPPLQNPEALIQILTDLGFQADIFTFAQSLPDVDPRFVTYHQEWDNIAVAPSHDFKAWWDALPQESRKNVRRSQKRGVTVRPVEFTEDLVHGIKAIYDETPYRQGRRFWHYGKDFATVKWENSSYLERSHFVGAFLEGTLIGFIKMVIVGPSARIMQILSMNRHFDKNVTNALVTSAVELCAKLNVPNFIYGQYVYGNKHNSSVTEFKRRNGFKQVLLPRYYVPMSLKGRMALAAGAHRGLADVLPEPLINFLLDSRSFVYDRLTFRGSRA